MLSFLTPMCTAVTGALLLKEEITLKQMLASREFYPRGYEVYSKTFILGQCSASSESSLSHVRLSSLEGTCRMNRAEAEKPRES